MEGEGAQGGVALSPQAVGALVLGLANAMLKPSSSTMGPVAHALRMGAD